MLLSRTEAARIVSEKTGYPIDEGLLRRYWEGALIVLSSPPWYDEPALDQALRIARFRKAGHSLQEIKKLMGGGVVGGDLVEQLRMLRERLESMGLNEPYLGVHVEPDENPKRTATQKIWSDLRPSYVARCRLEGRTPLDMWAWKTAMAESDSSFRLLCECADRECVRGTPEHAEAVRILAGQAAEEDARLLSERQARGAVTGPDPLYRPRVVSWRNVWLRDGEWGKRIDDGDARLEALREAKRTGAWPGKVIATDGFNRPLGLSDVSFDGLP